MKIIEGKLQNNNFKFAILASRFNDFVVNHLTDGAIDCLTRHGVDKESITVIKVPGSYELPLAAKMAVKSEKYDGIICLGALIKGETHHFDILANEVTKGLAQIGLEFSIPIGFGLLTAYSTEQAIERAGNKAGNKGTEAAMSCLEMLNLKSKIA
jgi:6,7-dimethyl-8-ribityllumazine synthase